VGGKARGQGLKLALSLTRSMMTVNEGKTSKGAVGYDCCYEQWVPGLAEKTLAIGSYRWVVWREGGQWQILNLKINEFFQEGSEALGIVMGVDTVIIRGNGNVVVRESKVV